ncbi:hypothetical protein Tco_0868877 [Tanacetum coccineum]
MDIHDVTPRVSTLAGCDRLVSKPLVIEKPSKYPAWHRRGWVRERYEAKSIPTRPSISFIPSGTSHDANGYVSLIRKKFCWGTIFPIGLKRYSDPKEEPIKKEPLMELKEIG